MGFLSALFGGKQLSPEEEKKEQEAKKFDLMKYDGVKAMKIGKADYAIRCFREALSMKDDLEIRDYLSQALIREGDLAGAVGELQRLAEAEPDNASIQIRIAQVAFMQEDYAQMISATERASEIAPSIALPYYLNAQACLGQKNVVGAVAKLTKAISLKADYAEAYLLRGQTLLGIGQAAVADADAAWLIKNVGAHEDVLLLKARIEAAKGNVDKAIEIYGIVTEVNPFSIEAFRERGQLKFNKGDKAGAEADMQKVMELDPNSLADVSGEYSAEGIEQRVKQAYSAVNPLGL